MSRTPSLLTLDGVPTSISSVYVSKTMGGVLEGTLDFIWRVCVDDAPADIKRHWSGPPVHMLRPPRHDRRRDRPPAWRINVHLESDLIVEPEVPGRGEMDGSHLTLVFFRHDVFDMPFDYIVALAVAQIEWKQHAKDWSW